MNPSEHVSCTDVCIESYSEAQMPVPKHIGREPGSKDYETLDKSTYQDTRRLDPST